MTVTTASPVLGFTDWLLSLVQEVVEESGYDEHDEWWDKGEVRLRQPTNGVEDLAFEVAQDPDWPQATDDLDVFRSYLITHFPSSAICMGDEEGLRDEFPVFGALQQAYDRWQAYRARHRWDNR